MHVYRNANATNLVFSSNACRLQFTWPTELGWEYNNLKVLTHKVPLQTWENLPRGKRDCAEQPFSSCILLFCLACSYLGHRTSLFFFEPCENKVASCLQFLSVQKQQKTLKDSDAINYFSMYFMPSTVWLPYSSLFVYNTQTSPMVFWPNPKHFDDVFDFCGCWIRNF